jgi:hypothetical protein
VTAGGSGSADARQRYSLVQRHQRMAYRLHRGGFPEGTVFHSYHAYECVLSALIAATGHPVPPAGRTKRQTRKGPVRWYPSPSGGFEDPGSHKARILLFDELADRTKPYCAIHNRLKRFVTFQARLDVLHYDPSTGNVPRLRFSLSDAIALLQMVGEIARAVRPEIPWCRIREPIGGWLPGNMVGLRPTGAASSAPTKPPRWTKKCLATALGRAQ